MTFQNICAIIVTYHPDQELLSALIEKLSPQVGKIFTIDNTVNNIGLGAAYNMGVTWAKQHGFEYVLLFDQDSCPAPNMVEELYKAYQTLSRDNQKVAAVGPNHIDARTNKASYAVQMQNFMFKKKCFCADNQCTPYIPSIYLISSGSLISITNFTAIGLFDESLFIDSVDIEWGLRAKNKGYLSWYICPAVLYHRMGDNVFHLFGKIALPIHNPLRCFYMLRNAVLLCKRKEMPLNWKLLTTFSNIRRYVFYALCSETRLQHIKMMSLGIWHGLLGKTGKYSA